MAKRSQPLSKDRVYPLITAKERLAAWEKARGVWKGAVPNRFKNSRKYAQHGRKNVTPFTKCYTLDTNAIL